MMKSTMIAIEHYQVFNRSFVWDFSAVCTKSSKFIFPDNSPNLTAMPAPSIEGFLVVLLTQFSEE